MAIAIVDIRWFLIRRLMPKVRLVYPEPKHWTPFLVRAIMPDVPILLEGNAHNSVVIKGVLRGVDKRFGWVMPFRFGQGVIFIFSWKTIARYLNKDKPLIIRKNTPRMFDAYWSR